MRTRRFANTERIRSKERRLQEVLKRRDLALLLGTMPKGVLTPVSHTTIGTSSTIHTPLRALVATAQETWRVDFADVPDPTGGFEDVVIPAAKQIGELASDQVLSFAGQPVGTYVVYAQHNLVDENPEQRDPPGKYAGGTGVFPEHRDFFGHGKPDGTPIPREGYDATLTPEVVSEAVDRLTIAFAPEGSVPTNATPLISVVWNGTSIASSTVIARTLDFTTLYDHIGAGGNAHATATTSTAGFMSAADKQKLSAATFLESPNTLAMRDSNGRLRVANPSHDDDATNRGYVDDAISDIASALDDHIGSGGNAHAVATTTTAGFMSATDKSKLDGATSAPTANRLAMRDSFGRLMVAAPATGNDAVNKSYVDDTVGTPLANHIGAGGAAHPAVTTSVAGFMLPADKAKLDAATSSKTANTLAMRDSSGRLRVNTPSHDDDAANKGYVDGKVASIPEATTSTAGLMPASDKSKLNAATSSKTANTLAMRDSSGRLRVNTPSHDDDAANKGYVDDAVAGLPSAIYWGRTTSEGTSAVAPPGWTVSAQTGNRVRITHNLGTTAYGVALTPSGSGPALARVSTINANYFEVVTLAIGTVNNDDLIGIMTHVAFYYTVIVS